ncbi:hypothetical protein LUZ62_039811 [Rhynchospora pubera]|uniref:Uncharacterized protein n=1 Tax=Rhynchospora pubera TaxID=906938 RepID=A0AAV8FAD1_9POAL|nr:hypothetical protein LUZ62_039811 [Rhynchospora pubera]
MAMVTHLSPSLLSLPSSPSLHLRSLLSPSPPSHRRRAVLLPLPLCSNRDSPSLDSSSTSPPLRVAFSGTDNGSHIYSSIAIADSLSLLHPNPKFLFLSPPSPSLSSTSIPSAGYTISPISNPFPSFFLLLPVALLHSTVSCLLLLSKFKPHVFVGTGGYLSLPAGIAAFILGIKVVVQEQNSSPGIESRVLGTFAERVFLGFNGCVKYFQKEKCMVYGNPVRVSLKKYTSKAAARLHFFPGSIKKGEGETQVILVLGGQTSASAVNYTVLNMYADMLKEHKNRYIIWQTGPDRFAEMESLVRRHKRLLLTPFLYEMDLAYAAADVVVSRAGAMTCTEILATGKPSIVVPLPNSPNDHQTKNAYIMAEVAGSKVLTEDELDSSSLEIAIDEILGNDKLREEMSEKALSVAKPNASMDIAKCILSLLNVSAAK